MSNDINKLKEKIINEGNYKAGEYKGFKYRIIRPGAFHTRDQVPSNIHLCGYVALPKENCLFGKEYDDINIDCHGGLTYSENHLMFQPEKDMWWIGFDCAHAGDFTYLDSKYSWDYDVYRDMEYVENECKSIIDQLIYIEPNDNEQDD